MKVLLAMPVSKTYQSRPDLGLGYLLTTLKKTGHEAFYYDGTILGSTFDNFETLIRDIKPDVVGFKIFSKDITYVNKSYRIIKDINPKIVTLGGGPPYVDNRPQNDEPSAANGLRLSGRG